MSELSRIDRHLPDFDFTEHHHRDIDAPQAQVYEVARTLDFSNSRVIRTLFKLRGIHVADFTIEDMASGDSFKVVDEDSPNGYVIVMAGRGTKAIPIEDAAHFGSLKFENGIKIAWNFRTEPLSDSRTRLHTETRTACFGRKTKWVFRGYWAIVRPFSGLIRREMLKAAERQLES